MSCRYFFWQCQWFRYQLIAVGDESAWEETQVYIEDMLSYLVAYNDGDGEAILTIADLDWSNVDIQAAGIYAVSVTLEVCEEDAPYYVLSPQLQNVSILVCISDPEAFELFPARSTETEHVIYFLPDIPSEETQIYACFSDGACTTEKLATCDWALCDSSIAYMKSGGFVISRDAIEVSHYGYFYLQYGDMQSQIVEVYENGEYTSVVGMGGDRDGGDANMLETAAVTQPAPAIPAEETTSTEAANTPESVQSGTQAAQKARSFVANAGAGSLTSNRAAGTETTAVSSSPQTTTSAAKTTTSILQTHAQQMEYSDSNTDILSGYRVRLMMEQSGGIARFSKNGITVAIPENAISFEDTDMITASVQPVENHAAYEIQILVNDTEADIWNSLTIWFPESCFPEGGTPTLEIGGSMQLLEYDKDSSAYRIETTQLGTFSLAAENTETNAASNESHWVRNLLLTAGVGLVAIAGLICAIWYFRRKGSK
ncbi:MAG: hypothetical protein ACI4XB_02060 [Ruminococcus sp.]